MRTFYANSNKKRRQIDKERKEMDPEKAKDVAADEGAVLERKSEQHSTWSDSEEERNPNGLERNIGKNRGLFGKSEIPRKLTVFDRFSSESSKSVRKLGF